MTKPPRLLRNLYLFCLPCTLLVLTCGCPLSPGQTVILDENDSGTEVSLNVGSRLWIVLSGNASTGYEWEVTDLDSAVLEHTDTSSRSQCAIPKPGCGQIEAWKFTALSPGSTTLNMVYHRPWEDTEPSRTFTLGITVTGSE